MVPMISFLSLPWVLYPLYLNEHNQTCFFCTYLAKLYITGSGAAAAISLFEDRYKPNMEVRQLLYILIDIFQHGIVYAAIVVTFAF